MMKEFLLLVFIASFKIALADKINQDKCGINRINRRKTTRKSFLLVKQLLVEFIKFRLQNAIHNKSPI